MKKSLICCHIFCSNAQYAKKLHYTGLLSDFWNPLDAIWGIQSYNIWYLSTCARAFAAGGYSHTPPEIYKHNKKVPYLLKRKHLKCYKLSVQFIISGPPEGEIFI